MLFIHMRNVGDRLLSVQRKAIVAHWHGVMTMHAIQWLLGVVARRKASWMLTGAIHLQLYQLEVHLGLYSSPTLGVSYERQDGTNAPNQERSLLWVRMIESSLIIDEQHHRYQLMTMYLNTVIAVRITKKLL